MIIHVVKEGETLSSIADIYGVSTSRIILDNEITNADELLPGQNIVIQYTGITYTVQEGDTLESIAANYGTTRLALLQNNPILRGQDTIFVGQTIVIEYSGDKLGDMSVSGYAYTYINRETLIRTLPYLTYLIIFSYGFTLEGGLTPADDEEMIALAKQYQVAPILCLTTITSDGSFSPEYAHELLTNPTLQDTVITNLIATMQEKGYYGIDIDFEFIPPEDTDAYVEFINTLRNRMNEEGFSVSVALVPKTSATQIGALYEAHDYERLGAAANSVLLMTYEWGYTYGPPMAVAPLNKVREVLDYGVSAITPASIFMGIPNYGYDWPLPFVRGETKATTLGNVEAFDQAVSFGVPIQYDTIAQSPHYNYINADDIEHEVWFENAQSIEAKIRLVPEYKLQGVTYWQLMRYFPANWLVVNALFNIRKVL